ncbi:MAG: GTP-dependent dephospho-CoA kinase family protein [Halobacteriales archaeon]
MALVRLPVEMRGELKEPMGPVEEEPRNVDGRLVAVGDVVTYHLLEVGVEPDLALVDGRTERERVDDGVRDVVESLPSMAEVENPAGTVTAELVRAIDDGLDCGPGRIDVDGEEDLAVLPALVLAEDGDVVVYGQPGEGMVYVDVDGESRERALHLLLAMDVEDEGLLRRLLGVS